MEKGKASLLPQPALESAMEEKAAAGSPQSQKNEAQDLDKNTWLFQLQLLRGHRAAAPAILHCFSWLSGRNTRAGHRWLLLSVCSLSFPASLHLSILPSLSCSSKFYFLALPVIHQDYFSFSCTEKEGYL